MTPAARLLEDLPTAAERTAKLSVLDTLGVTPAAIGVALAWKQR